jgi:hypothetical protein
VCRLIGVHASDIREEFKEFKEFEESKEAWRGAALERAPLKLAGLVAHRAETGNREKQAAPGNYPAFGNSIGLCGHS